MPPVGVRDRTPEEIFEATMVHLLTRSRAMLAGVCPDCGGTVECSFEVCAEHESGGEGTDAPEATGHICDACGHPTVGWIEWTCNVCKAISGGPSWIPLLFHPDVAGFLSDHGVDYHDDYWRMKDLGTELGFTEDIASRDPVRLRITIALDSDTLAVTLDERLQISNVARRG